MFSLVVIVYPPFLFPPIYFLDLSRPRPYFANGYSLVGLPNQSVCSSRGICLHLRPNTPITDTAFQSLHTVDTHPDPILLTSAPGFLKLQGERTTKKTKKHQKPTRQEHVLVPNQESMFRQTGLLPNHVLPILLSSQSPHSPSALPGCPLLSPCCSVTLPARLAHLGLSPHPPHAPLHPPAILPNHPLRVFAQPVISLDPLPPGKRRTQHTTACHCLVVSLSG